MTTKKLTESQLQKIIAEQNQVIEAQRESIIWWEVRFEKKRNENFELRENSKEIEVSLNNHKIAYDRNQHQIIRLLEKLRKASRCVKFFSRFFLGRQKNKKGVPPRPWKKIKPLTEGKWKKWPKSK